jgi:hypothetical protein
MKLTTSESTSIGSPKEKSPPSKIKEAADHAGLSVQLVSSNHGLYSRDKASACLNNSLWIAQLLSEITDAMEDGHQAPSTTSKPTVLPHHLNIHTELSTKTAVKTEEASNYLHTDQLKDAQLFKLPSQPDQFQSLSMPPTGANMPEESSTTAPLQSTTPSCWSELLTHTGKSRTLGDHGEKVVISDLPPETLVVSAFTIHPIQLLDSLNHILLFLILKFIEKDKSLFYRINSCLRGTS